MAAPGSLKPFVKVQVLVGQPFSTECSANLVSDSARNRNFCGFKSRHSDHLHFCIKCVNNSMIDRSYYKQESEFVYREIFEWNVYNITETDIKGANVLDIGCHLGMFTTLCHDLGAKRIVSIESNSTKYNKFLQYIKAFDEVRPINMACSDISGRTVAVNDIGITNIEDKSVLEIAPADALSTLPALTITLADALNHFPDNEDVVLKMDIEGAEYKVLYNTPLDVLRRFKIIAIEVHKITGEVGYDPIDNLEQFILSKGFIRAWKGQYYTVLADLQHANFTDLAVFKFIRL